MNPARLLAHFETISEAPDAVARLRRFILDLAVRGKLVEQDPEDEPAEEQLERIILAKLERARKQRGSSKKLRENGLDSLSYALPPGWVSASLADLVTILNGRAYKQAELLDSGTPVLRVGNLFTSNKWYYSDLALEDDKHIDDGDLIFAWSASFGPFVWRRGRAIYHYHIWKLPLHSPCDLSRDYLYLYLQHKTDEIKGAGRGISMVHMTKEKMELLEVPLPPLAEQHRIVAKVDELMALCDQLEAARQQREQHRERLVAATLQHLNQPAEDAATARNDARFALQVLPSLTTTPAQIKQLRQTILNLAVRGKLVEQDPEDEDQSARGKLSGLAESCPLIPDSWLYLPLGALLDEDTRNGYSRKPDDAEDGFPILRISAGTARADGLVEEDEFKLISGIDDDLAGQYAVKKGDLLACRFNGNKAYVGRLSLFTGYSGRQFIYPDKLIRVRVSEWLVEPSFVRWISGADLVREEVEEKCATTVGNWGISAGKLKVCRFPLPPLAEQHRIVAKVDALMALCDQLEQQLSQADQQRRRLLEAVLAEALVEPEKALASAGSA